MKNKKTYVAITGFIGVIVTKYLLNKIGIDNISLEFKVLGLIVGSLILIIQALNEKNIKARNYLMIFSGAIASSFILLAFSLVVENRFPELNSLIKKPLDIICFLLFVGSVIPLLIAKSITNNK